MEANQKSLALALASRISREQPSDWQSAGCPSIQTPIRPSAAARFKPTRRTTRHGISDGAAEDRPASPSGSYGLVAWACGVRRTVVAVPLMRVARRRAPFGAEAETTAAHRTSRLGCAHDPFRRDLPLCAVPATVGTRLSGHWSSMTSRGLKDDPTSSHTRETGGDPRFARGLTEHVFGSTLCRPGEQPTRQIR